ncbi:MAG TPA: histidinol dehydrogenase, partial [Desulfurivibrionaceae bacterium]
MIITPVTTTSARGTEILAGLRDRFQPADSGCRQAVTDILADIRQRGDEALIEYIRKFDAPTMSAAQLQVSDEELHEAMTAVDDDFLDTLEL